MSVSSRQNGCGVLLVLLIAAFCIDPAVVISEGTTSVSLPLTSFGVKRPEINVSEEVVFSAGVNVTVRCIADRPVTWNAMPATKNGSPSLQSKMTIINRQLRSSSKYESLLVLTELIYLDTGFYQCVYPGETNPELVASSYFYIYDGIHLLVSDDNWKIMDVVEHRKGVISWCRSTHPGVNVTLEKKFVKPDESFPKELVTYDPRLGFVVSSVTSFFDGAFICKALYKNLTGKKNLRLTYYASTRRPPKVRLSSDHQDGRTLIGETVTVTCNATFGSYAKIQVNWFYPLQNEKSSRIDDTYKMANHHKGEATAILIVHNFTMHDSGSYGCLVKDHDDKMDFSQINMTAFEKSFVSLTTSQQMVEVQLNKGLFILSVDVNAYPDPELRWFKDGHIIKPSPDNRDKYRGWNLPKLVIHNIHYSDAGTYTLRAKNRDAISSLDIKLLVNYAPSVRISAPVIDPFLYLTNSNCSLDCHSDGFPEPEVHWMWQKCDNATCVLDDNKWKPVELLKNGPWVFSKSKESRLTVNAKESGWYKCVAFNKIGNNSDVTQFYVTDVKDGFGIQTNHSSPVTEGESFVVSCLVSQFLFNVVELFWIKEDSLMRGNISDDLWIQQNSENQWNESFQYTVVTFQNEYHIVSTLSFASVQLTDNGSYACVARDLKGNQQIRTWELNIDPAQPTDDLSVRPVQQTEEKLTTLIVPPGHLNIIIITISVCLGVIVSCFIATVFYLRKRPRYKFSAVHLEELLRSSTSSKYNPDLPLDEQTDVLSYDPQLEFPKDRLQFDVVIGKGAFGTVYRAQAFGINDLESVTTVAVKTVKDSGKMDQLKALISELKVLIHLGQHINILNALGAVTQDISKGSLYLIMEYCLYGCLRDHLIKQRCHFIGAFNNSFRSSVWLNEMEVVGTDEVGYLKASKSPDGNGKYDSPMSVKDLVCYAFQIARGLEYLHSKKYIHRDLAARNILLAEGNVVKICDFGLAKDCYKYNEYRKKSSTPVPIKWMAIESLTHNVYTTKSDIWSYGIVLWELFTVGGHPYPTLKIDTTFIHLLKAGYRLERPFLAEDVVYHTMLNCWNSEPGERPDASHLVETFGGMLEATVKQHYIDLKVQSIDYLRMNSKSGCLETLDYSNVEGQSRSEDRQTRTTITSFESGFSSPTKAEAPDHFEYLPPSTVNCNSGDSGWSTDLGSSLPSPSPDYENAKAGLLMRHATAHCGGASRSFLPQDNTGSHSLSFDFSSGISDAVFEESDSYSPSPYSSAGNPLLAASM